MTTLGRWRAGARAAARLAVSRAGGPPALVSAVLHPTHRCNLRCTYCNSPFMKTAELGIDEWLHVVDELAALGCRRVAILGGEPLLYAGLDALIERARSHGMGCTLTSNGLLVPKHIDRLRRLTTLVLSLDAAGPANDAVRGEGVFAAVQSALQAARGAGIAVKINGVISTITAPHLDALIDFVTTHRVPLTLNVVRSSGADLYRDAATIAPSDEQMHTLLQRLESLSRHNPMMLFSPRTYRYASTWGTYQSERIEAGMLPADDPRVRTAPRCHAGRSYLTINPDGTVFPCSLTVNRIAGGNVARDSVAAAWRSLHNHPCIACSAPCLVEQNHLCSLTPSVMLHYARRYLPHFW